MDNKKLFMLKEEVLAILLEEEKVSYQQKNKIEKSNRRKNIPLSFAQQRLWFIDQLEEKASQAYHIAGSTKLTGSLNRNALISALNRIVERHESLRTTFKTKDGVPVQVIGPPDMGFNLQEYDAGNYNNTELSKIYEEETTRSFDLSEGPLIRGQLLKLSDEEHILLFTMHHIVSDAWSMNIFMNEFSSLYHSYSRGESDTLPDLPIQYADYAIWQRNWLKDDILQEQLSYWRDKLSGSPELLELPADHSRPIEQDYSGSGTGIYLDADLTRDLISLSRRHEVTLFMTLLAGWGTLLSRLSGQEDLTIGTPVANRTRIEIEPLIGFFVNTLVLRLDFSGSPTVAELMAQVKETALEAQSHQDIPFEQIVEELQPERSLSHSPLFQVMFSMQNTTQGSMKMEGINLEPIGVPLTKSQFDLSLDLMQTGDMVVGRIDYATSLFEHTSIDRYLNYWKNLLKEMVADEENLVNQIELMRPDERRRILYEWNDTEVGFPNEKCIHELFEEQVERLPDAISVVYEDQQITYSMLNIRANQLGNYLVEFGVKPESRVAIGVERNIEMVEGLLAILKAGGAYVPLDPAYPGDRLSYMLEDSAPAALLTQSWLKDRWGDLPEDLSVIELDSDTVLWEECSPVDPKYPGVTSHQLAYVIYTSGSTGRPKGVMVEHGNVARLFSSTESWYNFDANDVWTLFHSYAFDFSVWEIWGALLYGGRLVVVPQIISRSPEEFYSELCRHGVTILNQTPSAFRQLIEAQARSIQSHSLREIIFGGEALEVGILKPWYSRNDAEQTQLINMYGITETTVHVTYYPLDPIDTKNNGASPIGSRIPDLRTYILDKNMEPVPVGVSGELYVGGAGVARGYLNSPELTPGRFLPDPFTDDPYARMYKTGDLGRLLPDRTIEFLGRNDFQVKIRGFRIELGEIESRLRDIDGIKETIVMAREDDSGGKCLTGYYTVMEDAGEITAEGLRSHLALQLPDYMLPSAYVALEEFPLTPNGKIDRKALPAPNKSGLEKEYVAPRNEIEIRLTEIWSDVLGIEKVGINDNFFDLGGHSLLIIRVQMKISKMFKKEIKVVDLFAYPTIKQLSDYINNELDADQKIDGRQYINIRSAQYEPIAVIGMVCRFPGIRNVEEFWLNLRDGKETISRFTEEELISAGEHPAFLKNPSYVRAGSIIDDFDKFDAEFFGYFPRHAESTDPQHRIFLECAHEALEVCGYAKDTRKERVGVFAGSGSSQYLYHLYNSSVFENSDPSQISISNEKDHLTTLVSYKLNLKGPSANIQNACSTSLVAVDFACQSLLNNGCDIALAGGVSISIYKRGYIYKEGDILSPDGHCRAFDAKANGTAPGNGVGIVVLKRLKDALADGDNIEAVILGSAINNDGSMKIGYTAPSVEGQTTVIRQAQIQAGIKADTISYIEAHGTGTILGDPIEIKALTQAFREDTEEKEYCAIGSVKTNIGHADTAAGVAGLIKTVMAIKHKQIPASLHFKEPNPEIDFKNSPFYVNTELRDWETNGNPRRAGVSSFGIGGTNAHVIVEEAPSISDTDIKPEGTSRPYYLISLSAKTSSALEKANDNLLEHLESHPNLDISDVAYTLHVGRQSFDHRRILVCRDADDAKRLLKEGDSESVITDHKETKSKNVIFMFPGQGAQYVNMGLELYRNEKTFQDDVDFCAEYLKPDLGLDLRSVIFQSDDDSGDGANQLKQTSLTQPVLFVIEYALARLLMSWGIKPDAMIGHSIGEYVAACLSGVFSLEDCLTLVALRGRLIQNLPKGSMLTVELSEKKLRPLLEKSITIATVNSVNRCSVSGPSAEIESFKEKIEEQGITCFELHTSHAFHSGMMEPVLEEFADHVKNIERKPPLIPFISNVTGTWITEQEATDPDYWSRHIRHTVRFSDGIKELLKTGGQIMLEVGPGRTLRTLVMQHPDIKSDDTVLNSIRHPHETASDMLFMLTTLGRLWVEGVEIDWSEFYRHEEHRRMVLPTYPFERQRYWIDPQITPKEAFKPKKEILTINTDIADWFYVPSWERTIRPVRKNLIDKLSWVVFLDETGVGLSIVEHLKQAGQDVTSVIIGKKFCRFNNSEYTFNPRQTEDYKSLLEELQTQGKTPNRIIHCWNITNSKYPRSDIEHIDASQDIGFYSLLSLSQALGDLYFNNEIQIVVLSNNMHEVFGEDLLYPEKTTLLGPIKVIPQEFPNIKCKSIDITDHHIAGREREKLIDFIMSEISDNPSNSIIAYRGDHRWEEDFRAVRLDDKLEDSPHLKEGGVYLITGGLGSMGLAFSKYIAQKKRAKLVLIGRSEFPPRNQWEEWLSESHIPNNTGYSLAGAKWTGLDIDMEDEADRINEMETEISYRLGIKGLESYPGLENDLNELCSIYISRYFYQTDLKIEKEKTYNKNELYLELKILPAFKKFYDFFLRTLAEDNIIRIEDDYIMFLKDETDIKKPDILKKEIIEKNPGVRGLLNLLDHCAGNYVTALSEEMKAIGVLYPDGSNMLLEEYGKDTVVLTNDPLYLTLLCEIFKTIVKKEKSRKLRILEVGAGSGTLTRYLLEVLKNQDIEYYFTDIGKTFINSARKYPLIERLNFMKFGIFDISKDPEEQGYERFGFDIILGYNVVHATPVIKDTIENLKKLLTPDGILSLIETVKSRRWNDMISGLAEGWWYFNDEDLRKESPLLCLDDWEEVLRKQGFKSVKTYPQDSQKRNNSDSGLIIAQQDPESCMNAYQKHIFSGEKEKTNGKILKLKELEELGSEVIVACADVSNMEQMRSVISMVNEKFGHIDGVIHTAGILGQGMIYRKTREEAERTLAPKVKGPLILKALLHDKQLDFFILCSSMSSINPFPGQVDYCAANAFLDAFAFYNTNQNNTLTVSIDWGFWQELGMIETAEKSFVLKKELEETIKKTGLSNAGVMAFDRILSVYEFPQVIVSTTDISKRIEEKGSYELVEGLDKNTSVDKFYSRPKLDTPYIAPKNQVEQAIADIWQELLGIEKIGIEDNFFSLGGDSLISMQILNRIHDTFGVELSPNILYEKQTIEAIAEKINDIYSEVLGDEMDIKV